MTRSQPPMDRSTGAQSVPGHAMPPGQQNPTQSPVPSMDEQAPPVEFTGVDFTEAPAGAPTQVTPASSTGAPHGHPVKRSRFGGLWVGLIVAAVILVLLLVFVLQNSQSVEVEYFGFAGRLPLAVAILLGVAAGALLVAIPGTVRILQLRRTVHRS